VDPSLDAALRAVLRPLGSATPLPPRAHTDAALFEREKIVIFGSSWICAGREEAVEAPGSWLLATIADESVIVARGPDLALRAFHNACRHRASPLVTGTSGRAVELTCPYHGWTYDLTGALERAPFAPEGFDRTSHGLVAASVSVWQGFVFVAVDAAAPPLAELFGEVPPWLDAAPLASLRRIHRADYETRANWKLCGENFQESHHFERVHPSLEAITASENARSWLRDGAWLGGIMEISGGNETVSTTGRRADRPRIVPPELDGLVHDALLFPALFTSLQPDYLLTYRLDPRSVSTTHVTFEIFAHPSVESAADVVAFWDRINAEDRSICERQQMALRSRFAAPSCYASVEDGVHAFDRLVAKTLLGGE
jgi:phenylpropionate dioxygenase-like ring-hydroxylating dioxygenase large terminal subunit